MTPVKNWPILDGMNQTRHSRNTMDPELRERIVSALSYTYQTIAYDCGWGEKAPSKAEFVDVLLDQLRNQCGSWSGQKDYQLTDEEIDAFHALPQATKRKMCLEVGP